MTHTRYILHRIGIALGINRRTQRLTDIASESHLLREAEAHLGKLVWGHLESVEELSAEYWGLRKLTIEHRELHQLIDEKEQELSKLQKEQSGLINKQSESDDPELTSRHDQATQELEGWIQKREKIGAEARKVRKQFNGANTQLEVITLEKGKKASELKEIKSRIKKIEAQFKELKRKSSEIDKRIEEGDRKLEAIVKEQSAHSEKNRETVAAASMEVNQATKEISDLRSNSAAIESRMHKLHGEIGRVVSLSAGKEAAYQEAVAEHKSLVEVMGALRRSIALNNNLNEHQGG